MTAAQVVLDDGSFWLLVALVGLTSIAALVASIAAWRAARSARTALGQLEAARREVIVPDREWQEGSPIPWRAADAGVARMPPPRPPVEVPSAWSPEVEQAAAPPPGPSPYEVRRTSVSPSPPARHSDSIEDPDRPARPFPDPQPRPSVAPPPIELQTQPLSRPRPTAPPAGDVMAGAEREVHPGVFVRTPGRAQQPPEAVASKPPAVAEPSPAPQAGPTDPRLDRLDDPDPFVRMEAIERLRGNPALVDALLRKLHDDFPVVRRQAVRALRDVGTPDATRALLEVAHQDPSAEVREEAVGALETLLRAARPNPATRPQDPPGEAGSNPA